MLIETEEVMDDPSKSASQFLDALKALANTFKSATDSVAVHLTDNSYIAVTKLQVLGDDTANPKVNPAVRAKGEWIGFTEAPVTTNSRCVSSISNVAYVNR